MRWLLHFFLLNSILNLTQQKLKSMKIKLLVIGKTSKSYLDEGIADYLKRLKHYCNFEIIVIKDVPKAKNLNADQLKKKEASLFLQKISDKDQVILLDEKGKHLSSRKWSENLEHFMSTLGSHKDLVYIIGGAFGFDADLHNRANGLLSLSKMTFSHQMIRMIFVEQLYRAFTIIKNEKYHND